MPIQELLIYHVYQPQFFKYMLSLVTCRRLVAISVTVWASRKLGMKIKVNFAIRNPRQPPSSPLQFYLCLFCVFLSYQTIILKLLSIRLNRLHPKPSQLFLNKLFTVSIRCWTKLANKVNFKFTSVLKTIFIYPKV